MQKSALNAILQMGKWGCLEQLSRTKDNQSIQNLIGTVYLSNIAGPIVMLNGIRLKTISGCFPFL